ncbi:hypothetical protein DB760_21375, partial [Xanthomonas perforans]|uniref:hypothetical protein n=1 Tax=Xanthomonas perforans TaxID=442694 RepID=UPI00115E7934
MSPSPDPSLRPLMQLLSPAPLSPLRHASASAPHQLGGAAPAARPSRPSGSPTPRALGPLH